MSHLLVLRVESFLALGDLVILRREVVVELGSDLLVIEMSLGLHNVSLDLGLLLHDVLNCVLGLAQLRELLFQQLENSQEIPGVSLLLLCALIGIQVRTGSSLAALLHEVLSQLLDARVGQSVQVQRRLTRLSRRHHEGREELAHSLTATELGQIALVNQSMDHDEVSEELGHQRGREGGLSSHGPQRALSFLQPQSSCHVAGNEAWNSEADESTLRLLGSTLAQLRDDVIADFLDVRGQSVDLRSVRRLLAVDLLSAGDSRKLTSLHLDDIAGNEQQVGTKRVDSSVVLLLVIGERDGFGGGLNSRDDSSSHTSGCAF